jgi:D-alanine transfer protein
VAICVAVAAAGSWWAKGLVTRRFDALRAVMAESKTDGQGDPDKATYLDHLNSLGTTLQREAFAREDQLPLYGSSELVRPVPQRAGRFFRDYPTGFAVYPVGRPGTDCLVFLQRIAALGRVTDGKRVALSLSPTWFYTGRPSEDAYVANFSSAQALRSLLNARLDFPFRRELAQRLLLHPSSLKSDRLLRFLAARLAGGQPLDRASYAIAWPLAETERAIHTVQDRFEVALYIERRLARPGAPDPRRETPLDWDLLLAEATAHSTPNSDRDSAPPATEEGRKARDLLFRDCLAHGREWEDLELLLRGLRQMKMKTLVLCMPLQEGYYERTGVTQEALALLPAQVREIAGSRGAQAECFEDHVTDAKFQMGHGDHLSNRGWMYYNRVLDGFYHAKTAPESNGPVPDHRKHLHAASTTRHT